MVKIGADIDGIELDEGDSIAINGTALTFTDGELDFNDLEFVDDGRINFNTAAEAFVASNRIYGDVNGHFLGTSSSPDGHLPWVIRSDTTNTLIADSGDVSIPNGDLTVDGDTVATQAYIESADQNVNGDWVFGGDLSVDSEVYLPNATGTGGLRVGDSGLQYTNFEDWATVYARSDSGAEGFRVRNTDGDGDVFTVGSGGDVDVPNGELSEQGNRVATRTYVDNQEGGGGGGADTVYLTSPVSQSDLDDAQSTLTSDGGTIVIPAGEHADRWAITTDNITLRGTGKEATLKVPDGVDEPAQCLTITGDNVKVENLTIDGNKDNQDVEGYNTGELQHADGIGIYADNCTISNVDIYRAMSHSVIVWNWNNDLGAANASLPAEQERFGNVIEDCLAVDNGLSNNERACFDTVESRRTIFRDNNVEGGEYTITAFTVHTGDDIILRGNHINNPDGLGFQFHSEVHNVLAEGNTVRANGGLQTYNNVDDIRIVNNTFDMGSYVTGIAFQDMASNILFSGNTVTQAGGTRMFRALPDSEHVKIVDNTFHNMYVQVDCTTPGAVMKGNTFKDYDDVFPINISDATGVAIQNNYVHYDSDGDSQSGTIVLDDGFDCLVAGNTIVNGNGVFTGGGSSGNEIRDNHEIDE